MCISKTFFFDILSKNYNVHFLYFIVPKISKKHDQSKYLNYFSRISNMFPTITIVIPCFNEESRIGRMFDGIKSFVESVQNDFEIILINDGSNDGTDILISNHPIFISLKNEGKIVLFHQENKGKGAALKLGIMHANKDFVLTVDADMATSPLELIKWFKMRKAFYNKEILIGSRELKNSVVNDSFKRKIVGNIFNFLIRKIVGLKISDTQCGFKLYPTQIAKKLFENLQTNGWAHDVEILSKANKMGCAIIEMPITWTAIEGSKINVLHDGWNMFWEILKIRKLK